MTEVLVQVANRPSSHRFSVNLPGTKNHLEIVVFGSPIFDSSQQKNSKGRMNCFFLFVCVCVPVKVGEHLEEQTRPGKKEKRFFSNLHR